MVVLPGLVGFGIAEKEEILEGALVHAMEAAIVAVDRRQFGPLGEVAEGADDAVQWVRLGAFGGGISQEAGFDGPEAALTPNAGDHFLDGAVLGSVGGFELGKILVEKQVENFLLLAWKKNAFG